MSVQVEAWRPEALGWKYKFIVKIFLSSEKVHNDKVYVCGSMFNTLNNNCTGTLKHISTADFHIDELPWKVFDGEKFSPIASNIVPHTIGALVSAKKLLIGLGGGVLNDPDTG